MKTKNFNPLFYLKKVKSYKSGYLPICLRISVDGKRRYLECCFFLVLLQRLQTPNPYAYPPVVKKQTDHVEDEYTI
jgi:hypothetical protein